MNKRITIIASTVLVALLAIILIVAGVKSCDDKKDKDSGKKGYDEVDASVGSDVGEIYDFETGEIIAGTEGDKNTNNGKVDVDETVGEPGDISDDSSSGNLSSGNQDGDSSNTSSGSSSNNSSVNSNTNTSAMEGFEPWH